DTLPSNPLPLSRYSQSNVGSSASRRRERPSTAPTQSQPTQYAGGAGIAGQLLVGGGSIQTDNAQPPSTVINDGVSTQAVPATNTTTGSGVPVATSSSSQATPQPP